MMYRIVVSIIAGMLLVAGFAFFVMTMATAEHHAYTRWCLENGGVVVDAGSARCYAGDGNLVDTTPPRDRDARWP